MSVSTSSTLLEMRRALAAKEISSAELTKAHLERAEKCRSLNAFIEVVTDNAMKDAAEADKRIAAGEKAPLLGVPVAIKDMILTAGVRTTAASKILSNFIAPYDATVTVKLKAAGAVNIGKTNLDEFAMGSSTESSAFGQVKNPWNQEYVPGGSSGGSAAAVSAGLCAAALGTDTGGSIRQPASLCNLVGLKPTYGRVSRYGVVAYASSLDQVGPFARTVEDCAEMTEVLCGYDPKDSTSVKLDVPKFSEQLKRGVKGLRIGVPKEYFISGLNKEVETAVKKSIQLLEQAGAKTTEISLPHTELAVATYYIIAPAEASSNLARYDGVRYGYRAEAPRSLEDLYARSRSEGFGKEVKRRILIGSYVLSAGYYDAYYLRAQKVRTLVASDFKKAFAEHCDVIACPTAPTPAFKLGEKTDDPIAMYLSDVFTIPVNLAGLPGMSIPAGFSSNGLPIGLQLIGKPFDETTLFAAAAQHQSMTNWHTLAPKL